MRLKIVPDPIRRRLRPLPQWTAIGTNAALDPVRVWLMAEDRAFEVTQNHVVAALKPFTLALGLSESLQRALDRDHNPLLVFSEEPPAQGLATLQLRLERMLPHGKTMLGLFRVAAHRQRCLRWPYRAWNRWLQERAAARHTDPANIALTTDSQQQIMVFYIRPRPVVLVSVECGEHRNIFPMDLIGPLSPGLFTLALRSTSRSVAAMTLSRRVALSDIAAADVAIAHDLGRHHRAIDIDWAALPFALQRSVLFALPVPAIALRVRELEIMECVSVGSHILFICRQLFENRLREGSALCHISGISQYLRSRRGQPLPAAPQSH